MKDGDGWGFEQRWRVLVGLLVTGLAVSLLAAGCDDDDDNDDDEGGTHTWLMSASMSGAAEVPGPGDTNGTGTAYITLNRESRLITYEINTVNIDTPVAAHIHRGTVDVAGPVVVDLGQNLPHLSGTTYNVSRDLIDDMIDRPWAFYVNVHTAPYPAGAIRGQLFRAD